MSDERVPLASFEEGWTQTSFFPDPTLTFLQVFGLRLRETPLDAAITVVKASGRDLADRTFTFAELDRMARTVALALAERGLRRGDRVIVSLGRPDEFLACFLACQAMGAVPVPVPSLGSYDAPEALRSRVRAIASDCAPRAMVVERSRQEVDYAPDGVEVLRLDRLSPLEEPGSSPAELAYEASMADVAFLQYTSGSTGSPKGVVVDHYNLVANFRSTSEAARFGPGDRAFSWLPVYHDMGLIGGLLLGIYLKIPTYVMATRYFVTRPDAWLRAISRYRATFSVAPNFAYSLVARRMPDAAFRGLDLSCWRLAFDGAEPIDRETIELFAERLGPYGFRRDCFYPVYGLAECTLGASFPVPGRPPRFDVVSRHELVESRRAVPRPEEDDTTVTLVSSGPAIPGHGARVVDLETGATLPERCVGEIVISGPSVTRGYFGKPPRTDGELHTGDLGYLADGELYIAGRRKDVIILAGCNYFPSDIEAVAQQVAGVSPSAAAAFGVTGTGGGEELVVVVTWDPRSLRRPRQVERDVQSRIREHLGISPREVVAVPPGTLPKTSSGKIQRADCRRRYEDGELQRVDELGQQAAALVQQVRRKVLGRMAGRQAASEFPPAAESPATTVT